MSNFSLEKLNIEPCIHEETDTRLLLHVLNGANSGIKKISIIIVDTDVVVIALRHFFTLSLEEFWIEFGVDKYRRCIRFIHVQKHLVGNYAAVWRYGMHLQDVIQFQASTGKERRLLGKYCDYLMKDWLHLQGSFFLKYFTSPFRRKQLFVGIILKVYLRSQAWLSAKPCAWFKIVGSYWFYYFM